MSNLSNKFKRPIAGLMALVSAVSLVYPTAWAETVTETGSAETTAVETPSTEISEATSAVEEAVESAAVDTDITVTDEDGNEVGTESGDVTYHIIAEQVDENGNVIEETETPEETEPVYESEPLDVDNDIEWATDPVTEQYLLEHANPDYVTVDENTKAQLVNAIVVKQTLAMADKVDSTTTIDDVVADVDSAEESGYLATIYTSVSVYDVDVNSDYYVAYVNTLQGDDQYKYLDCDFALNDNGGNTIYDCVYEDATGIAYLSKGEYGVNDNGNDILSPVQIQLLQAMDFGGTTEDLTSNVAVATTSDGDEIASSEVAVSNNPFAMETVVQSEAGLDKNDISVSVNGLALDSDNYTYDEESGQITLNASSAGISSVAVDVKEETIVDKIVDWFTPDEADALSYDSISPIDVQLDFSQTPTTSEFYTARMYTSYNTGHGQEFPSGTVYNPYSVSGKVDGNSLRNGTAAYIIDPKNTDAQDLVANGENILFHLKVQNGSVFTSSNGKKCTFTSSATSDNVVWLNLYCSHIKNSYFASSPMGIEEGYYLGYRNVGLRVLYISPDGKWAMVGVITSKAGTKQSGNNQDQAGSGIFKMYLKQESPEVKYSKATITYAQDVQLKKCDADTGKELSAKEAAGTQFTVTGSTTSNGKTTAVKQTITLEESPYHWYIWKTGASQTPLNSGSYMTFGILREDSTKAAGYTNTVASIYGYAKSIYNNGGYTSAEAMFADLEIQENGLSSGNINAVLCRESDVPAKYKDKITSLWQSDVISIYGEINYTWYYISNWYEIAEGDNRLTETEIHAANMHFMSKTLGEDFYPLGDTWARTGSDGVSGAKEVYFDTDYKWTFIGWKFVYDGGTISTPAGRAFTLCNGVLTDGYLNSTGFSKKAWSWFAFTMVKTTIVVKETNAPKGYDIPDDLANGITITMRNSTYASYYTNSNVTSTERGYLNGATWWSGASSQYLDDSVLNPSGEKSFADDEHYTFWVDELNGGKGAYKDFAGTYLGWTVSDSKYVDAKFGASVNYQSSGNNVVSKRGMIIVTYSDPPSTFKLSLTKSLDSAATYSGWYGSTYTNMEGAVYGVYTDENCTQRAKDVNGYTIGFIVAGDGQGHVIYDFSGVTQAKTSDGKGYYTLNHYENVHPDTVWKKNDYGYIEYNKPSSGWHIKKNGLWGRYSYYTIAEFDKSLGTVYIKEELAPYGCRLDTVKHPVNFKLMGGDTYSYTFKGTDTPNIQLTMVKYAIDGQTKPSGLTYSGAIYGVYADEACTELVKDIYGNTLGFVTKESTDSAGNVFGQGYVIYNFDDTNVAANAETGGTIAPKTPNVDENGVTDKFTNGWTVTHSSDTYAPVDYDKYKTVYLKELAAPKGFKVCTVDIARGEGVHVGEDAGQSDENGVQAHVLHLSTYQKNNMYRFIATCKEQPTDIKLYFNKSSSDTATIANDNGCYTLAGALYVVYADKECTKLATDNNGNTLAIVTDENGTGHFVYGFNKLNTETVKGAMDTVTQKFTVSLNKVTGTDPDTNKALANSNTKTFSNGLTVSYSDDILARINSADYPYVYIKEVVAPKGYKACDLSDALNSRYQVDDSDDSGDSAAHIADLETASNDGVQEVHIKCVDTPVDDPFNLTVAKLDSRTGKTTPGGEAEFQDAIFELRYYDNTEGDTSGTPKATWYFITKVNGKFNLKDDDPVPFNGKASSVFHIGDNDKRIYPIGTYVLKEVQAPKFYSTEGSFTIAGVTCGNPYEGMTMILNQVENGGAELNFYAKNGANAAPLTITTTNKLDATGLQVKEVERRGKLNIVKKDGSNYAIPGVEYALYTSDKADATSTYTFQLGESKISLNDASSTATTYEFNGTTYYLLKTGTTDANGELVFDDLIPTTYLLCETSVPSGYTLLKDPVEITVPYEMSSYNSGTYTEATDAAGAKYLYKTADTSKEAVAYWDVDSQAWCFYQLTYNITNTPNFDMPMSGGNGFATPVVVATSCVTLAAVAMYFFLKKRNSVGVKVKDIDW